MIAFIVVSAVVVAWLMRRRSRRTELAGLDANRPVFGVTPAHRRHHKLKGETL